MSSIHNDNCQFCVRFEVNINSGLPIDYLIATRVHYATIVDMHKIWDYFNPLREPSKYSNANVISLRNEIDTLTLFRQRILDLVSLGLDASLSETMVDAIDSIFLSIDNVCNMSMENVGIREGKTYLNHLTDRISPRHSSHGLVFNSTLRYFQETIHPFINVGNCSARNGTLPNALSRVIYESTSPSKYLIQSNNITFRVVEVPIEWSDTSGGREAVNRETDEVPKVDGDVGRGVRTVLRGLLVSSSQEDVSKPLLHFSNVDPGGFMTTVVLTCTDVDAVGDVAQVGIGGDIHALSLGASSDHSSTKSICTANREFLTASYHKVVVILPFLAGYHADFIKPPSASRPPATMSSPLAGKRLLSLGIGGGELIGFLLAHHPALTIHAVDVDDTMTTIARRFFDFPPFTQGASASTDGSTSDRLHVFHKDAWQHLQQQVSEGVSYDVVVVDIFDETTNLNSTEDTNLFTLRNDANIQLLANVTARHDGLAIIHLHSNIYFDRYFQSIAKCFADTVVFETDGSKLVVASHTPLLLPVITNENVASTYRPCENPVLVADAILNYGKASRYDNEIPYGARYALLC